MWDNKLTDNPEFDKVYALFMGANCIKIDIYSHIESIGLIQCIKPFLEFKQSVKWLLVHKFGALSGALSGVNNIELNELESKVYEAIKINQNLTAKEKNENQI